MTLFGHLELGSIHPLIARWLMICICWTTMIARNQKFTYRMATEQHILKNVIVFHPLVSILNHPYGSILSSHPNRIKMILKEYPIGNHYHDGFMLFPMKYILEGLFVVHLVVWCHADQQGLIASAAELPVSWREANLPPPLCRTNTWLQWAGISRKNTPAQCVLIPMGCLHWCHF